MPNVIKYSTGATPSGSLRKGNMLIGNNTADYGLTFFNGIDPPSGGYTIYLNKASGGPSIYCPANDTQLINITNRNIAGTVGSPANYTTAAQCLNYFATQTDKLCVNFNYAGIVTNGLIAALDASFVASYPTTGSIVYDISGQGADGTLNGTVAWVSSGSQSYFNFATSGLGNYISSTISQAYFDCTIVLMPDFSTLNDAQLAGLIATTTPAVSGDKSLRFAVVNGTGPWSLATRNPGDGNDWANPSATTYYVNGSASNVLVSGWNIFGGYRTNTTGFPATFPYFLGSGGYSSGNRGFQGKIAVALLYNRQLSAAEQTQNYNALRGRFGL